MKESSLIKHAMLGWHLGSCSREWLASFGAPSPNIKVPVCHVLHSPFVNWEMLRRKTWNSGIAWPKSCLSPTRLPEQRGGSCHKSSSAKDQVKDNEMCGLPVWKYGGNYPIPTDPIWKMAQLSLQLVQCGKLFSFVWSGWETEFN